MPDGRVAKAARGDVAAAARSGSPAEALDGSPFQVVTLVIEVPCATSTYSPPPAGYTEAMPSHRRLSRCKTAVLVVLSLLFSQMALANYLCPAQLPARSMGSMEMAPGAPCDGMDPAQPALCYQHAADPGQVVQAAQVVVPSLPAIVQVLFAPMVLRALDAIAIPWTSNAEARPPPDPIFLATLRLRV
jgi:hypothetical protein